MLEQYINGMGEMLPYYSFAYSCLLSTFVYLGFRRKDSRLKQAAGLIVIFGSYFFSFEIFLTPVNPLYLSWAIPVCFCILALFFSSVKTYREQGECMGDLCRNGLLRNGLKLLLIFLLQFTSLSVVYGFPWLKQTFAIDDVDAVLFTLQTSKQGAWGVVFRSFGLNVLQPTLCFVFVANAILIITLFLCYKKRICFKFTCLKKKIYVNSCNKLKNFYYGNVLILMIAIVFSLLTIPDYIWTIAEIFKAYTKEKPVVNSILYEKYYVPPDSVKIEFDEKKNLVYIMLESMATDFVRNLPELKKLQDENLSFDPGGESVATQSITIKSQVAKYCGIPLKIPTDIKVEVYLPNAVCIQDLLPKFGYKQLFVQGTSKKFSSFGNFLETHSNVEMHDFDYFESSGRSSRVVGSWGIDDFTLFEMLKEDLMDISKDSLPFAVYVMTMDTHWPSGYLSDSCNESFEKVADEKQKYYGALRCASINIGNFMEWARQQDWYENTVLVIQGDHVPPSNILNLLNWNIDGPYYWYNTFVNVPAVKSTRKFSALDMYPTVLEAMGAKVDGHGLGLGRSILSDENTLLEIFGKKKLDSLLLLNDQMDAFFAGIR